MTERSSDKLHICFFADERSIHTKRWVRGLRELGHRVDLVTLIKDNTDDIGGISLNARSKLSYLTKIFKLRKIVNKLTPDIFHAHHASSFGFLGSFVNHPRKVLSVWGNDVIVFPYENIIFKSIVKRAIRGAHFITATSFFLEKAVKLLTPKIKDIRVIAFGIDINQFKFSERPDRKIVTIGIAKSLTPKYGIDILIKAFKGLSDKYENIRLSIAGKGEYADQYKDMVLKLGLSKIVEFKGFLNHGELPGYFSTLDIFAMPSISDGESFGVAALEASASGLPLVVSNVGGVPEVIESEVTGFLVERKNAAQLAAALEKLILNRELRLKMGRAGREFVENNYRWEDNLKSMNDLYLEIMK